MRVTLVLAAVVAIPIIASAGMSSLFRAEARVSDVSLIAMRDSSNYKNEGKTSKISRKACNRLPLSQPPSWLTRYVLPTAGIIGIFGLILLFGPWRHQSLKQQNVGFLCFVVGIVTLASTPLMWEAWSAIEYRLAFDCSSEDVRVSPVVIALSHYRVGWQ